MSEALIIGHQLGRRLLISLGVAPLTIGCSDCSGDSEREEVLADCVEMRRLVELGLENIEAGCSSSGAQTSCREGFPEWATGYPSIWNEGYVNRALAWDPATGCPSAEQYEALTYCMFMQAIPADEFLSEVGGICSYRFSYDECNGGRPFLVDGEASRAPVTPPDSMQLGELSQAAHEWLMDARTEHASIASFARLSLQLMAFGAPIELVRMSQEASLDEERHVRLCLEQAKCHGAKIVDFGPLNLSGYDSKVTMKELLMLNIVEGCIGETLAAGRARAQAQQAAGELAEDLNSLAEDEERHAQLAWRILQWQLGGDSGELKRFARHVFSEQLSVLATGARERRTFSASAPGRLSSEDSSKVDAACWRGAVTPLVAGLLS